MTKQELIEALKHLDRDGDIEVDHIRADGLLLQYINDDAISEAYHAIRKWYA